MNNVAIRFIPIRLKYGMVSIANPNLLTIKTAMLKSTGIIAHTTGLYAVNSPFLQNNR